MSTDDLRSLIQNTYFQMSDIELIQTACKELFGERSLTDEAASILKKEIETRQIDIESIYQITSFSDEIFFDKILNGPTAFKGISETFVSQECSNRLRAYQRNFECVDIVILLDRLRNLKLSKENNSHRTFLALRIYLSRLPLKDPYSRVFQDILTGQDHEIASLDIAEKINESENGTPATVNQEELIHSELENTGKALRMIGTYLVRYAIGSVGAALSFFFLNPGLLGIVYFLYGLGTLILFILITSEFFKAGDALIRFSGKSKGIENETEKKKKS